MRRNIAALDHHIERSDLIYPARLETVKLPDFFRPKWRENVESIENLYQVREGENGDLLRVPVSANVSLSF